MIPIYAYGIFDVTYGEVIQHIIFEYVDPGKGYAKIVKDREKLIKELAILKRNMQAFLDAEEVKINGVRVYPKVVDVKIGFSGTYERPYIKYVIIFDAPLKSGVNVYEDKYEPEVTEYDYVVTWVFPKGSKVLDVNVGFNYEVVNERVIIFHVPEGSETPGYESISFLLP